MKQVPVTVWYGCYERQWSGVLIPDAFKHPAKFARGLVERLLDYGVEKGYWQKGDRLGDPFGGIGGGAIPAADRGFEWIGSELEAQFVEIGNRNLAAHGHKWLTMHKPLPKLVQGDSRNFADVVRSVAGCVTSPPYNLPFAQEHPGTRGGRRAHGDTKGCDKNAFTTYGQHPAQIDPLPHGSVDAAITSPPFGTARGGAKGIAIEGVASEKRADQRMRDRTYLGEDGERDPANIEKLEPGKLDGAVTSPPYATIAAGAGGLNHLPPKQDGQQSGRAHAGSQDTDQRYGDDERQLAKLETGSVEAVVTSPPYADSVDSNRSGIDWDKAKRPERWTGSKTRPGCQAAGTHKMFYGADPAQIGRLGGVVTSPPWEKGATGHVGAEKWKDSAKAGKVMSDSGKGHSASPEARQRQFERDADKTYGDSEGQIGRAAGETYWMAMNRVYASCFEAIKPGGVMCVVVKDYVRAWKRVPLCDDTMRLLCHVGFEPVERIHAMVTEETRHGDLFEGETVTKKSRKSFFRRLQERRGAPPIDYEQVLIVRKPK